MRTSATLASIAFVLLGAASRAPAQDLAAGFQRLGAEVDVEPGTGKVLGVSFHGDAADVDLSILGGARDLETLSVSGPAQHDPRELWSLSRCPNLRGLSLPGCGWLTDEALPTIGRLSELQHLDLSGSSITDEGLQSLANLDGPQFLDLSNTAITGAGLAHLSGLKHLQTLHLDDDPLGHDGLAALESMTDLRIVSLGDCGLDDAALARLSKLTRLESISLGWNPDVGDAGIAHLAACRSLRWIRLEGTRLSPRGLAPLGRLEWLRSIWLDDTATDDETLDLLATFPAIAGIELDGTRVTYAGLARLLRARPDVSHVQPPKNWPPEDRHRFMLEFRKQTALGDGAGRWFPWYQQLRDERHELLARTALGDAIEFGDVEALAKLIEGGAVVDESDVESALRQHQFAIARALRAAGAPAPTGDSFVDLVRDAILGDRRDVLAAAVAVGGSLADVDARIEGGLARFAMEHRASPEMLAALLASGLDAGGHGRTTAFPPLLAAVESGEREFVSVIVAAGADVNARTSSGWTAAMLATRRGDRDLVDVLVAAGASRERLDVSEFFRAVDADDVASVRRLVAAGVDVDARDQGGRNANDRGRTALNQVAWRWRHAMLATLLELGADPNSIDEEGRSPLWAAVCFDDVEAVELLLEHGADASLRDSSGESIDEIAHERGVEEIVALVERHRRSR